MSTWVEFYQSIKDPSWPECEHEQHFDSLPQWIQQECTDQFGYQPGSFQRQSKLINKTFPIHTATACQLKWTWSTVYLTRETTASCHRTDHHKFDAESFNFHNTERKINDRQRMLQGQWPQYGCNYCQDIERAGGVSDRITNLNFPGIHAPPELEQDLGAVSVTPRMLEVYFDNTCNLKCLYCGPHFSSLWDAENIRHGDPAFNKSKNIERNKHKLFDWLKVNSHQLTVFNILGGEPLFQPELMQCLDLFEQHPAPELKLQIFSNLNAKLEYLQSIVKRVRHLIDCKKIREFEVTASLDCWGAPQQYVRYPLDLGVWQTNFEYLLSEPWINLIINSTITPLTVKTLPDLLQKINDWNTKRPVYHYQNSVSDPSYLAIDIFGEIFDKDFDIALSLKPTDTIEQQRSRDYLKGIALQASSRPPKINEICQLYEFLNKIDHRRKTHWPSVFPWLVDEFAKYNLKL